jgi:hypothetical protein
MADKLLEYLGFSWLKDGVRIFYKFLVLPFGLASACYSLTKITRPLVKKWRSEGKQIIMYLDDGIGIDPDEHKSFFTVRMNRHS